MPDVALIRLLHLASPTLPVGAYTYSQALEWAVESGVVRSEPSTRQWILDVLTCGMAHFEAVYLAHMLRAWREGDLEQLETLNEEFIASRETAELRAETLQMGHSMVKLLADLPGFDRELFDSSSFVSFPFAWSCAASHWGVPDLDALSAYLWAWVENQVMAALKAVPLGQTAGQRMLLDLGERLPELARQAVEAPLASTHNFLPAYAIASSLHETQYTRIFRS